MHPVRGKQDGWCSWKLEGRGNALFLLWIAFFIFQIFDLQEITDMQLFSAFERDSWCGQPRSREANVHCTLQRKPKSSSRVLSSRSLAEPQNWLPCLISQPPPIASPLFSCHKGMYTRSGRHYKPAALQRQPLLIAHFPSATQGAVRQPGADPSFVRSEA